jgi:hypothetical protein
MNAPTGTNFGGSGVYTIKMLPLENIIEGLEAVLSMANRHTDFTWEMSS